MGSGERNDWSEEALIQQVKVGNRLAFRMVYDRFWESLFQAAYKLLRDVEAAQDAVQEVFTDLWKKREELTITNLGGYLYQAARFQALKQLRRIRPDDVHEARFSQLLSSNPVEEVLHFEELQEILQISLNKLPEKYQQIFELSRVEQLSNKEIAQRLNLSTRTVEWYLHSILRHLRSTLPAWLVYWLY